MYFHIYYDASHQHTHWTWFTFYRTKQNPMCFIKTKNNSFYNISNTTTKCIGHFQWKQIYIKRVASPNWPINYNYVNVYLKIQNHTGRVNS